MFVWNKVLCKLSYMWYQSMPASIEFKLGFNQVFQIGAFYLFIFVSSSEHDVLPIFELMLGFIEFVSIPLC